jgi:hypothetical protein
VKRHRGDQRDGERPSHQTCRAGEHSGFRGSGAPAPPGC